MAQSAEQIVVTGGWPLNGTVRVPAAKNSVLPLLAAALLCQRPVRLRGVPRLSDVECSLALLRGAGCTAQWQGSDVVLSGSPVQSTLPGQTAAQMRASILFCAPLLARLGRAETVLPGGCRIGSRPIDLHLTGLARMGVQELDAGPGRLVLLAPSGLHGAEITLRFPSVGATETLLLAAACAGAAPCCGEPRGNRRSQTWPISSTGAAAVWRGREAPRSSLRGGGRWAGACFRPCRTVFLPPRWPVRRPPPEAGWN